MRRAGYVYQPPVSGVSTRGEDTDITILPPPVAVAVDPSWSIKQDVVAVLITISGEK